MRVFIGYGNHWRGNMRGLASKSAEIPGIPFRDQLPKAVEMMVTIKYENFECCTGGIRGKSQRLDEA